jgi:hypothetical protein
MAFADDFATSISESLGVKVDTSQFDDPASRSSMNIRPSSMISTRPAEPVWRPRLRPVLTCPLHLMRKAS